MTHHYRHDYYDNVIASMYARRCFFVAGNTRRALTARIYRELSMVTHSDRFKGTTPAEEELAHELHVRTKHSSASFLYALKREGEEGVPAPAQPAGNPVRGWPYRHSLHRTRQAWSNPISIIFLSIVSMLERIL